MRSGFCRREIARYYKDGWRKGALAFMNELQWILWTVSAMLEILVLSALIRGTYKRYPFIFAYVIILFLTQAVEIAAKTDRSTFKRYFWIDDVVRQLLIFCIVIALVHRAMEGDPRRNMTCRFLILAALILGAFAFYLHRNPQLTASGLMTLVSRDLNFFSVFLNMALWLILISAKTKNRFVLALSGGLGIQFCGAAIGHGVRILALPSRSQALYLAGSLLLILSHHLCLFIWWRTFRHQEAPAGSRLTGEAVSLADRRRA